VLLQHGDGHVQMRAHQRWGLHHVHEWRPCLLCDDSGELRLHDGHDRGRLRLLRLHE
jgi:hypothetical protein